MDLCECKAKFGDIAKITRELCLFCHVDKISMEIRKTYIKDVGWPRTEKRNGNKRELFE